MAELAVLIGIAQIVGYLLLLFSIWGVHWSIGRLPDWIARAIREDWERQRDIEQWRERQQTQPSPLPSRWDRADV